MSLPTPGPRPADPRARHGRTGVAAHPDAAVDPDPDAELESAMAGLDELPGRPPAEHVAVFERIHAALGDALAAAPPAGGAIATALPAGGPLATAPPAGGAPGRA
jgi:hypothetical protein